VYCISCCSVSYIAVRPVLRTAVCPHCTCSLHLIPALAPSPQMSGKSVKEFEGPARVYNSEDEAYEAIVGGEINAGIVYYTVLYCTILYYNVHFRCTHLVSIHHLS
jgi:hypothetical protein